jgi:hypothetical protein
MMRTASVLAVAGGQPRRPPPPAPPQPHRRCRAGCAGSRCRRATPCAEARRNRAHRTGRGPAHGPRLELLHAKSRKAKAQRSLQLSTRRCPKPTCGATPRPSAWPARWSTWGSFKRASSTTWKSWPAVARRSCSARPWPRSSRSTNAAGRRMALSRRCDLQRSSMATSNPRLPTSSNTCRRSAIFAWAFRLGDAAGWKPWRPPTAVWLAGPLPARGGAHVPAQRRGRRKAPAPDPGEARRRPMCALASLGPGANSLRAQELRRGFHLLRAGSPALVEQDLVLLERAWDRVGADDHQRALGMVVGLGRAHFQTPVRSRARADSRHGLAQALPVPRLPTWRCASFHARYGALVRKARDRSGLREDPRSWNGRPGAPGLAPFARMRTRLHTENALVGKISSDELQLATSRPCTTPVSPSSRTICAAA